MTCLDCKAAPGGICAPHKLATSFDAPTEEEEELFRLRADNKRLLGLLAISERENGNLKFALSRTPVTHRLVGFTGKPAFVVLPSGMCIG